MSFFNVSHSTLRELVRLTGGVALLTLFAVAISQSAPASDFNFAAAAATYKTPGTYTVTVPYGAYALRAKLWAGGGRNFSGTCYAKCGGYTYCSAGGSGGGGGYTSGTIPVTPGQTISVVVGNISGYSGIFLGSVTQANAQLIAGGGGTAGYYSCVGGPPGCGASYSCSGGGPPTTGAPGGGLVGSNSAYAKGGTQTAGGTGAGTGGPLTGGAPGSYGGAGGSGYFGGGGGPSAGSQAGTGGAGGSAYCASTVENCVTMSGSGTIAGNPTDSSRAGGAGNASNYGYVTFDYDFLPPPILTITGNGENPLTVAPGTPVEIEATYTVQGDDTLLKSAINDNSNTLWCGSGNICDESMWTDPLSPKKYTFTPTTGGTTYVFYPAAQTSIYQSWNNYGKSLSITTLCPANSTLKSGSCQCNTGYTKQSDGSCTLTPCSNGAINPPTCNLCEQGYEFKGGKCSLITSCSDPKKVPPLCNTCISGYTLKGNACVIVPTVSLTAAQTLVRADTPASLSWRVTGAGGGISCSISSNPAGVFSRDSGDLTVGTWIGNDAATAPITGRTIFTLSCTNATPVSVTVGLIPKVQEI